MTPMFVGHNKGSGDQKDACLLLSITIRCQSRSIVSVEMRQPALPSQQHFSLVGLHTAVHFSDQSCLAFSTSVALENLTNRRLFVLIPVCGFGLKGDFRSSRKKDVLFPVRVLTVEMALPGFCALAGIP